MKEEDEVQGRGLRLPPGLGGTTHPGPPVPLCESLPCLHFPGQVFMCASGNPDPSNRDHRPRRARDLARTLAGLVCLHSLNVLEWATL